MKSATIGILPVKTDGDPNITVDVIGFGKIPLIIEEGGTIYWTNGLEKDANVYFSKIRTGAGGGKNLTSFCKGVASDPLVVKKGQTVDCELTAEASYYSYTIKAKDHGDFDPIIIIEDIPNVLLPIVALVFSIATLAAVLFTYSRLAQRINNAFKRG